MAPIEDPEAPQSFLKLPPLSPAPVSGPRLERDDAAPCSDNVAVTIYAEWYAEWCVLVCVVRSEPEKVSEREGEGRTRQQDPPPSPSQQQTTLTSPLLSHQVVSKRSASSH